MALANRFLDAENRKNAAMTEEEKDAQALAEMEDDLGIGDIDLQQIDEDI